MRSKSPLILCAAAFAFGCGGEREPEMQGEAGLCDETAVRELVTRFGGRLKMVSHLAEDSIVKRELRAAYASLVTSRLLETWTAEPSRAPGRSVSSPWPERIEVDSILAVGPDSCSVFGSVVYVSSADRPGEAAAHEPIRLTVLRDGGTARVDAYDVSAATGGRQPDAAAAVQVVRQYYAAIQAREFRTAYGLWRAGASGQTYEEFAAGYAHTDSVHLQVGEPGRVEGAAGSRYVEVPVVIRARTRSGEEQLFEGTYTLRRSVVDGATPAERAWRIHSADLRTGHITGVSP